MMTYLKHAWLKPLLLALAIVPIAACGSSEQSSSTSSAEGTTAQTQIAGNAPSSTTESSSQSNAPQEQEFVEDIHYAELFDPVPTSVSPGKIEVVELFWYSCPHCYQMEPELEKWAANKPADVELVQIPAVFKDRSGKPSPAWALSARAYYALEALGKAKALHPKIFTAIHEQGRRLNSVDAFARFVASQGVDEQKFRDAMSSLAVQTKTREAIDLTERYGITGVPALIVNGRYRVLNKAISGYGEMFQIVDYLAEKERSRLKNGG